MKKLIEGIVHFRKNFRDRYKDTFEKLALGQTPDALFIACSDSRVVPNLFASTEPGDLFVVRNVGNVIPICPHSQRNDIHHSESAAIEFALETLKVKDIIICGHSECGAMQALLHKNDQKLNFISKWLKNTQNLTFDIHYIHQYLTEFPKEKHNQLSQLNVLEQMRNLYSYDIVKEKTRNGQIKIHGWWFDLKPMDVYVYEPIHKKFVLIDENEASKILSEDDPSNYKIDFK